jgi:hypothetical protein
MNTYDPMARIVYRHLDQRRDAYVVPVMTIPTVNQLPSGYANRSVPTYLGRTHRTPHAA